MQVAAARFLSPPAVPLVDGQPNPLHPEYHAALQAFRIARAEVTAHALLVCGTEPIEIPSDVQAVDTDEWIEELARTEVPLDPHALGRNRYLLWLKYYALLGDEYDDLVGIVAEMSGYVQESAVRQALADYKSALQRHSDRAARGPKEVSHRFVCRDGRRLDLTLRGARDGGLRGLHVARMGEIASAR